MSSLEEHIQADSSYSRNYLTRSNNRYQQIHHLTDDPQILAERQRKNDELKQAKATAGNNRRLPKLLARAAGPSSRNYAITANDARQSDLTTTTMASVHVDEKIYGLPESSDEEDSASAVAEPALLTPANTQSPRHKRPLAESDTNRRSKRIKPGKEETVHSATPQNAGISDTPDELPSWLSQSQSQSSQKRPAVTYGQARKNFYIPPPIPQTPEKKRKLDLRAVTSPITTPESKRSKKIKKTETSFGSPSSSPQPMLLIPDEFDADDFDVSKATTVTVSKVTPSGVKDTGGRRRGSTSSLSSVDSIASIQLDKATKTRLKTDRDGTPTDCNGIAMKVPPDQIYCPVCKRATSKQGLDIPNDLSKSTMVEQQSFCYNHRIRDMHLLREEKGYPSIHFDSLPTSAQLQKHIGDLILVVKRKRPSYHLTSLDDAISAAKGNQTKINHYFDVTTLSTVHHGYFGPRGAKVISRVIAEHAELGKVLRQRMRTDKTMRIAGLGRLVDCVLLPEVLTGMVQEDMVLLSGEEGQTEARQILEESVEIGLMLCPDDDHVDVDEDDEFNDE